MATLPKRVAWDACTWIALIQREKIQKSDGSIEDRYALARSVIDLAAMDKIELVVSGLCLAEVCKAPQEAAIGSDSVEAFFEHEYILLVPVDKLVGSHARKLVLAHGLKPPDAVHVATALIANVDELHSFDAKILNLDGRLTKLDGKVLKICKPAHGGPPLPLLDERHE